jgi:hypothetical protein
MLQCLIVGDDVYKQDQQLLNLKQKLQDVGLDFFFPSEQWPIKLR